MGRKLSFRKSQSGQILIFVIIILVVAAIIIPATLGLTFTGHRSVEIRKQDMQQYYAADTGIEDALHKIGNETFFAWLVQQPEGPTPVYGYELPGYVNGYSVSYEIYREAGAFRTRSTAIDPVDGLETEVEILAPVCVLTITATDGGNTTPEAGYSYTYLKNTQVHLSATPDTGYNFVDWTGNGTSAMDNPYSQTPIITMDDNYNVQANFTPEGDDYYLLLKIEPEGAGFTTPIENVEHWYEAGTVVHLMATSIGHYEFIEWSGDVSTIENTLDPTTSITMEGNYTVWANFNRYYLLTVSSTNGGSVTTPGEGNFIYHGVTLGVPLVAEAELGYIFDKWTGDTGTITDISDATTSIDVNDDYSIVANFKAGYPCFPYAIASLGPDPVYIKKPQHIAWSVDGDVYVRGDLILENHAGISGNVYSEGYMQLKLNTAILGTANAKEYIAVGEQGQGGDARIYGNAYAGGDIEVNKGSTLWSDATAGESITVKPGGTIHGVQNPNSPELLPPFPPLNPPDADLLSQQYMAQADTGVPHPGSYEVANNVSENLGPSHITGDFTVGNGATVTLTGTVYVDGKITFNSGATIIGPGVIVANGDIDIWTNNSVPGNKLPLFMSYQGNINCKNVGTLNAVLYAPNGNVKVWNKSDIYGAILSESVETQSNFSVTYAPELDDLMNCPE